MAGSDNFNSCSEILSVMQVAGDDKALIDFVTSSGERCCMEKLAGILSPSHA
jgi:hypothetical protein